MVYAVVPDPEVVDNPDVPSYQPYVHGKCVPPALIPLHMHGVSMEADCCLDTAYVTVEGTWRVHCVTTSRKCDCRIAIPLGEQLINGRNLPGNVTGIGSLLGVEVDIAGRLFHTKLITEEDAEFQENVAKTKPGGRFLKGQIYTFKIPQVDGGSTLSIKVNWSQKLTYEEGQLCLSVPFNFPGYEVSRGAGKASFLYEAQVTAWSSSDLKFSYTVSSDDLFGGILLQSPSLHDFDQRQMFCLSLFPGKSQSRKVFRKAVVFLVDISGSMRGDLLENAKNALLASFSNLSPEDSFNIIAFNGEIRLFSSSMELASKGAIQNATQWLNDNLIADGGTEILLPLKQVRLSYHSSITQLLELTVAFYIKFPTAIALKLLSDTTESIPLIFLITDGTVEDERAICNEMKSYLTSTRAISPRICTFGIGSYCNHYFLQMLAQIGRGHYDSAYHPGNSFLYVLLYIWPDFVEYRIQRLFSAASSVILADVTVDTSKHVDSLELFPSNVPDLSSGSPLIVSGRYTGTFPDYVKVSGTMADMTNFAIDLKVQNAKDIQLDRLFARRQIDMLTARAWLSESKELEDNVAKMSIQTGFPSEYTQMLLLKSGKEPEPVLMQEVCIHDLPYDLQKRCKLSV
ncbi:hypothetical protein Patl1_33716 [Pistacia atlantica]|uniref:Uncharacterized protein n=1 Tax=Pistacia atlantica TaxID=434234 RepID=A0ACC0ZSX4_9ROSI|nr:hypothetical protein Patl1_33716 [Pistacia atlantica]